MLKGSILLRVLGEIQDEKGRKERTCPFKGVNEESREEKENTKLNKKGNKNEDEVEKGERGGDG
jgi:hypothetical protein